ncbi:MAG: indoleamine 2,3-dioxygenase [Pseudomonadota bacterium]
MKLADYDISAERGFLSDFEPERVVLPHALQPIRDAALSLPHWLPSGRIRALLEALPEPDIEAFLADATDAEARLAMVHYSFLVQSYVWGEPEAPCALPATLARPIWQIARRIGQQPLLPYSAYVLDNWGRIDESAGFGLDNVTMLQPFLGGQDEAWFVLIHVAIEARAGALLAEFPALLAAAEGHDASAMHAALSTMCRVWDDINAIFDRMPERCDPYIYFHRVRPWIHGWKDNPALGAGLIYDGVGETNGQPQSFRGQTGSQSSIVPAVDAVLGLGHADDPLRRYLDELHIYRPPQHRRFIDDVRARSTVREAVSKLGDAAVVERYNENVEKLARFRTRHLEYAATYINKQQRDHEGNAVDIGTGGTPFMKYLKKHRNETQAQLLRDRLAV